MKRIIEPRGVLPLFLSLAFSCLANARTVPAQSGATSNQTAITRLDGSRIADAEIDRTVTRLMQAAEVPGAGIAIIDGGKIA